MTGNGRAADAASLVERMIAAGPDAGEGAAALVAEFGMSAVVGILVDEIVFRCPAPVNTAPMRVAMDVVHARQRDRTVFELLRDRPVGTIEADSPDIHVRFEFTLTDLARRLFGPSAHRRTGDFRNEFLPGGTVHLGHLRAAAQAARTLLAGCENTAVDLGELAVRHGSDKWAGLHWYAPHYERHLAPLRDRAVRVLEIGIGGEERELGGASLKMWKRFFHRGTIVGVDVVDKSALDQPRLTTVVADQRFPEQMAAIGDRFGPFDIVIDDGSHVAEHVVSSFHTLLPYVRDGGLYVIEDLQTAYLPEFGGTAGKTAGSHTSIGLIRQLVDDVHHMEHTGAVARDPTATESSITGIHLYHNIVFLERGTNGEEGLPGWLRELIGDSSDR